VSIQVRKLPAEQERKQLFRLVRIGFSARRKMLANNLAAGFQKNTGETRQILKQIGLSERVRAQDLSVENWEKLAKLFL
jgi:16S rRNA (adenine1518-N6/adenine1519-N6)-dimethyltransferase